MSKSEKEDPQLNNNHLIEVIDLDEYNIDIDAAMIEMDNGEYISHEEVRKMLIK